MSDAHIKFNGLMLLFFRSWIGHSSKYKAQRCCEGFQRDQTPVAERFNYRKKRLKLTNMLSAFRVVVVSPVKVLDR